MANVNPHFILKKIAEKMGLLKGNESKIMEENKMIMLRLSLPNWLFRIEFTLKF